MVRRFIIAFAAAVEAGAQQVPRECIEFATCASARGADWVSFRSLLQQAVEAEATSPQAAMETYFQLMETYALDAGIALECRMGVATVFYRLGHQYRQMGYAQRAANLFQLAMSMFWDTSRAENGMACLQMGMWGIRWFEDFMEEYLGHAAKLQRNSLTMLPHPAHWQVPADYRNPALRIAVFSLCDYAPDAPMYWLLSRSRQNREAYCTKHGYGVEWTSQRPQSSASRHPVWGQLAGPLELLEEGRYDWILSMDCDSLFVNMGVTVDSLLYRFAARETPWGKLEIDPDVHFLISEDGRGLAGGNWIVRNSPAGRTFLREVYGPNDEAQNPYMRHDLRDQFSLLWHLVRPGASVPMPTERPGLPDLPSAPKTWADVAYAPGVRLVPQDLLLGSYPFVSCSQPGDRAHRCFEDGQQQGLQLGGQRPVDFIVSVPLLGALPQNMAQAMLDRFLLEGIGSLGQPAYDQELRGLCNSADLSRCLAQEGGGGLS
mmetsp:Transcript_107489/g.272742  ORF Transcript_107489/g.272742 Transcript_107489/m.272742 type:complete len:489 (+) Transcript_107489:76-1542(+)